MGTLRTAMCALVRRQKQPNTEKKKMYLPFDNIFDFKDLRL